MKNSVAALLGAVCAVSAAPAPPADLNIGPINEARDVDTLYPYTGPEIPVGDWVDPSVNGVEGSGFPRLVEPPAVAPASANPTNNINVISLSYIPNGVSVHFQTPFGLDEDPTIHWGEASAVNLTCMTKGTTSTLVDTSSSRSVPEYAPNNGPATIARHRALWYLPPSAASSSTMYRLRNSSLGPPTTTRSPRPTAPPPLRSSLSRPPPRLAARGPSPSP